MTDLFTTDQIDHTQITDADIDAYIGPNGKFARGDEKETVKELAKAKIEADRYIKTLEQGRDQLRADYLKAVEAAQTGPQVKELLDQLKLQITHTPVTTPQTTDDVNAPKLDPKQLDDLVSNKLREYEESKKAQENYNSVESKLKETYGSNYREVFQQKVREMGLSMDWAKQTALTYPQVLFKTLGLDRAPAGAFQAPPNSHVRSDNLPHQSNVRDWDFYEKMRRDNPTQYWNPKTQVQLHQDSKDPRFRTTSWNN